MPAPFFLLSSRERLTRDRWGSEKAQERSPRPLSSESPPQASTQDGRLQCLVLSAEDVRGAFCQHTGWA